MKMIDLKALAGDRYRLTLDPSAEADSCRAERASYHRIPCKHGFVSPHGPTLLAGYGVGRIVARLIAIPGVRIHQRGDHEARVLFPAALLDAVADVLKARRRPALSDKERQRRAERLKSLRKPALVGAPC